MSQPIPDDNKDVIAHDETYKPEALASQKTEGYQLKSEFDTLKVTQILWRFRKAIGFAVLVGIGALAEGYAGMING
jgi:hypothetical protein